MFLVYFVATDSTRNGRQQGRREGMGSETFHEHRKKEASSVKSALGKVVCHIVVVKIEVIIVFDKSASRSTWFSWSSGVGVHENMCLE